MKLAKTLFTIATIALLLSPTPKTNNTNDTSEITLLADGSGNSTEYEDIDDDRLIPKPKSIQPVKSI